MAFCKLLEASVSLCSGFHPQSNGQTEQANQELETILQWLSFQDPGSWSRQLPWVEYSNNSPPSSSTGLPPLPCCLGYQPTLFLSQKEEVGVPLVTMFILCCCCTRGCTCLALRRFLQD